MNSCDYKTVEVPISLLIKLCYQAATPQFCQEYPGGCRVKDSMDARKQDGQMQLFSPEIDQAGHCLEKAGYSDEAEYVRSIAGTVPCWVPM